MPPHPRYTDPLSTFADLATFYRGTRSTFVTFMAAAPPQIDPAAELAALRVRATALGASADTPDACLPEFETFTGKVLPLSTCPPLA